METELELELEQVAEKIREDAQHLMQNIRPMLIEKPLSVHISARSIYRTGRQFRVMREGARLEGIVQYGERTWAGYSKRLEVGDILTCNGWRAGMGNPGVEEANFTMEGVPWEALWVQVWPQASLWRPWPMEGYLTPLDEYVDPDDEIVDLRDY